MQRRRLLGLAVVALALAGLVSLGAYRFMRKSSGASVRAIPTLEVVAAAVPLAVGAVLQPNDLKLLAMPTASLPQHVFPNPKTLVGRVLTEAAVPNQVVVGEMVAAPGAGAGLPPLIPDGMRAVSVKVNDVVSVAGYAIPGTHVDVLLTGNPSPNNDPKLVTTVTLLSNVQVLTAGQQMEQRPDGKPETVTVITLLVDPAGAEKLALADGYGHIQLALRNPLDRVATAAAPLLNGTLYGERAPARRPGIGRTRPAPPPPPPAWTVAVISGSQQQVLKFPVTLAAAPSAVVPRTEGRGDHP